MVDVLTEHRDPNQRCTCGWKRFRESTTTAVESTTCWIYYDTGGAGGLGATPLGLFFGTGASGGWGEFAADVNVSTVVVRCENCTRPRTTRVLSASAFFGSYISGGFLYVVACGALSTGCLSVVWRGPLGDITTFLSVTADVPEAIIIGDAPVSGPFVAPPAGVTLATLLRTQIPSVPVSGTYEIILMDRCGSDISLGTVFLEVDVVVLNPGDADLNGAPRAWLNRGGASGSQITGPGDLAIPLDYCTGVLEYDARFNSLPDAQGWTHQAGGGVGAPANFALIEGGGLQIDTPGATNPSYWEHNVALGAVPTNVAMYAKYGRPSVAAHAAEGEGLDFQGLFGAAAANLSGVRLTHATADLYKTLLDTSGETIWPGQVPLGLLEASAETDIGSTGNIYLDDVYDSFTSFGLSATAAGVDELRARFGDVVGEGVTAAVLRNFVVSTPGRFLRAWFRAYATVVAPVLRLHLTSDVDGSGETLARFLVRYGPITPHTVPALQASASLAFTSRNVSFEAPITLTGLTANTPFWFTVERDWAHADDRTQATVWLTQATVRGS